MGEVKEEQVVKKPITLFAWVISGLLAIAFVLLALAAVVWSWKLLWSQLWG